MAPLRISAACVVAAAVAACGSARGAAVAPPRGLLAFVCEACRGTNTRELFVIRTDGSRLTMRARVCGSSGDPAFPSWAPGGARLVLACDFARGTALWTARPAGGTGDALTPIVQRTEQYGPEWSRDGALLTWERRPFGAETSRIVVARGDGTRARVVARGASPSWSRRGRLVFASGDGLFTARADGTAQRRLSRSRTTPLEARWSPDGRAVAFTAPSDAGTAVRILRLTDYKVRTVARTAVEPPGDLVSIGWAPGGRWLVYAIETRVPTPDPSTENAGVEVWLADTASGARKRVFADVANQIVGVSWAPVR